MSIETLQAGPIAPGVAGGPLRIPVAGNWAKPAVGAELNPCREIERFRHQVQALESEIERSVGRLDCAGFCEEADIMRVHLAMLRDAALHHQVLEAIQTDRQGAETAVDQVLTDMAETLAGAGDPMLAERGADLRDLAMRLIAGLSERGPVHEDAGRCDDAGAVWAVFELMPSLVLKAWELGVGGFVVQYGTAVSHAAILAKSFGIPVLRVANLEALTQFAGRNVLLRGGGEILVEPDEAELAVCRPLAQAVPIEPVASRPGARVWISIVDPEQLGAVGWAGVEGVGLYRSESLFLRYSENFPSEEDQYAAYRRLFELAGERPVVFRTADLGADKPVAHMHFGPQENPCLGLRAHRLFRFHPEILITQVRALLRAARGDHRLRLMYPMIETVDQLYFVQGLVERAIRSLAHDRMPFQRDFQRGVLVETPSAAWSFGRLLREVDFASVGTNDLVQYLFAVERNAVNAAELYRPEHPVVLQVIRHLAELAAQAGKPLSMCGEMAADASMLPVLVGLGIEDVSVAPAALIGVRSILSDLDPSACRDLARRCLEADTAEQVRELLGQPACGDVFVGSESPCEAIDPICGMIVHKRNTPYYLRRRDAVYYFCSRDCLDHFIGSPE